MCFLHQQPWFSIIQRKIILYICHTLVWQMVIGKTPKRYIVAYNFFWCLILAGWEEGSWGGISSEGERRAGIKSDGIRDKFLLNFFILVGWGGKGRGRSIEKELGCQGEEGFSPLSFIKSRCNVSQSVSESMTTHLKMPEGRLIFNRKTCS